MADAALELARAGAGRRPGRSTAVGIANQRASTIVWDRATGEPVGPGARLAGPAHRRRLPRARRPRGCASRPNQSATKVGLPARHADPDRARDLCFGTVDTWIAWHAVGRRAARHRPVQRRRSPACIDRRRRATGTTAVLDALRIPARRCCPRSSTRPACSAPATALDGAPPIAGIAGDQQASLIGQGVRRARPGQDHLRHRRHARRGRRARPARRSTPAAAAARFPIVAWRRDGEPTWGLEAIMLSAGTNVEWLRDDLGIIATARRVPRRRRAVRDHRRRRLRARPARPGHARSGTTAPAARCSASPGAPGARRSCGPCSRASPSAAPTWSTRPRPTAARRSPPLRVDGGMSRNPTFVQALADATQRPVEVSPVRRGHHARRRLPRRAGPRHLVALDDIAATWAPDGRRRARRAARPRAVGRRRRPGRRAGSPSCPASTSDHPARARPRFLVAGGPPAIISGCAWPPPVSGSPEPVRDVRPHPSDRRRARRPGRAAPSSGCGSSSSSSATADTVAERHAAVDHRRPRRPRRRPPAPPTAVPGQVDIVDYDFAPDTITVKVGRTVDLAQPATASTTG